MTFGELAITTMPGRRLYLVHSTSGDIRSVTSMQYVKMTAAEVDEYEPPITQYDTAVARSAAIVVMREPRCACGCPMGRCTCDQGAIS